MVTRSAPLADGTHAPVHEIEFTIIESVDFNGDFTAFALEYL